MKTSPLAPLRTLAARTCWFAGTTVCLVLMAVAADTKSKSAAARNDPQSKSIQKAIEQILGRPPLKGADIGVHVLRLSDNRCLFARQAERLLLPASNTKLLTTAAALTELGAHYEFRTVIGTAGPHLVIVGGGDPAISGRFTGGDPTVYFRRWAHILKDQGLTRFTGDLVVDDSFFDRQWVHPNWRKADLGRWYAAPVASLALNDSCIDVRIAPAAKLDAPAHVSLIPSTYLFHISNRTRTVKNSKNHAPRVLRGSGAKVIQCDGGVYQRAQPTTTWVTVDDPVMYFATVLSEVLAEEGITIAGNIRLEASLGRCDEFTPRVLHRFPLLPALAVTNKESQNFYAEQILKTLGVVHADGSWATGRRVAEQALLRIGLDSSGYVLDDGCGLSRANRASPRSFTTLLAAMHRGPHAKPFRETLSVAGVDGTLARRLTEHSYQGRIWAKTGSINGVRAISGYAQTRSGEWLAFSLLINNPRSSVRSIQDEFCKVLVDCGERAELVRQDRTRSK